MCFWSSSCLRNCIIHKTKKEGIEREEMNSKKKITFLLHMIMFQAGGKNPRISVTHSFPCLFIFTRLLFCPFHSIPKHTRKELSSRKKRGQNEEGRTTTEVPILINRKYWNKEAQETRFLKWRQDDGKEGVKSNMDTHILAIHSESDRVLFTNCLAIVF